MIVQSRDWMARNSTWMRRAQDRMSHIRELEEQRRREQSPKEAQITTERAGEYVLEYPSRGTRVHNSEYQPPSLPTDLREETPFKGETLPGYQPETDVEADVTVYSPFGNRPVQVTELQMSVPGEIGFSPATTPGTSRHQLTAESFSHWFSPENQASCGETETELDLVETFGFQIEGEHHKLAPGVVAY